MQKIYRLAHNSSFQYIFRNGKKYHSDILVITIVKAATIKVGISVSKKVGNSVIRSKVKRRIKEAFRHQIADIKGEYNFVVVAKEACEKASFEQIKQAIILLLKKADVYKEDKNDISL